MPDTAIDLYRRFLAGKPGTCAFTQHNDCHAFATEDEIEATYGSCHDGHHFVWLDTPPGVIGFIGDSHIDALIATNRIAFAYSEMSGPAYETHQGAKHAFLLGVARMNRILALPVDPEKNVQPDAIETLPLVLRARVESLPLPSPIPLAQLVEKMIPLGATVEDGEARGRLAVLCRAAIGADLTGIRDEAERFAAWIIDRAGRERSTDEIITQMFNQLSAEQDTRQ